MQELGGEEEVKETWQHLHCSTEETQGPEHAQNHSCAHYMSHATHAHNMNQIPRLCYSTSKTLNVITRNNTLVPEEEITIYSTVITIMALACGMH